MMIQLTQNRKFIWKWQYRSSQGEVIGHTIRFEDEFGKKEVIPYFKFIQGQFKPGINASSRQLFGLDSLLSTLSTAQPVFVVEGEKCAAALHSLGLPAVTSIGGADAASKTNWSPLSSKDIVILWPDNDEPGIRYVKDVYRELKKLPTPPKSILLFECKDSDVPGYDAVDWILDQIKSINNTNTGADPITWDGYEKVPSHCAPKIEKSLMFVIENKNKVASFINQSEPEISDDWLEPIPLVEEFDPNFPLDIFPIPIRDFVAAVAESTETPVTFAASLALAALATASHKGYEVKIDQDYIEPLALWICCLLPPGSRKTQVFKLIFGPIFKYERERSKKMDSIIKAAEIEQNCRKERIEIKKSKAKACKNDNDWQQLLKEITDEEENLPVIPNDLRLHTSDITPENLATLMSYNNGCMSIISDEASSIIETIAGRYSGGKPNLDIYLKGHSASDVCVDRQTKSPIRIPRPVLTFGLAAQPEILKILHRKDGFRGLGFLARFIFIMPKSNIGERIGDTKNIPDSVSSEYERTITTILDLCHDNFLPSERLPIRLQLSKHANEQRLQLFREIEPQLKDGELLGSISDWASKLIGAFIRIIGILHIAQHAEGQPEAHEIAHLERAGDLLEFMIGHALKSFNAMSLDPTLERAYGILNWILEKRMNKFTLRECQYRFKSSFKTKAELMPCLDVLSERYYIRGPIKEHPSGSGRPSEIYIVNPILCP